MPDTPDLDMLARRYVDLWQDQLLAVAADPEFIATLTKLVAATGAGLETHAALWRDVWQSLGGGTSREPAPPTGAPAAGAPGTAAAAGPPADGDGGMAELTLRIAALEERLARMEAGVGGTGRPPRRRPRRDSAS